MTILFIWSGTCFIKVVVEIVSVWKIDLPTGGVSICQSHLRGILGFDQVGMKA